MNMDPIYSRPGLYDEALPRYIFDGSSDEELLHEELTRLTRNGPAGRVLELGCGTGRMTRIIRDFSENVTCIDSSITMLEAFRARYPALKAIHTDARTLIDKASNADPVQRFDLIVACWSLNYPLLECFETNTGSAIVPRDVREGYHDAMAFLRGLVGVLSSGGRLVAFFFDPDSAEQRFVTDTWESVAPFPGTGRNYTRELLLRYLSSADGVTTTRHHAGQLHSRDLAHAEQWFLDGHFKSFPQLVRDREIQGAIRDFLTRHAHEDGSIQVPAGVYVTTFTRS